jgi:NitT/TauT family transport system substrate-binding protein
MTALLKNMFISVLCSVLLTVQAEANDKVVLALNWIPHSLHFGIYLAKKRGWYDQAGLDVNIERGYGSGDTVKRVATGAADFGLADAASVALGRANGANTKLVAMLMDRPADGIYFVTGAGIEAPRDLQGKTMGAAAGETSLNLLPVFAKRAGIDPKKIEIVTMSSPNKIPSLVQRKVDTIVTFTNEEPMIKNAGRLAKVEIGRFLFADYGVDYYSVGLIAADSTLQNKPEITKKFVNATMRGYAEAFAKPEEALDAFIKNNPASSRELMQEQWATLRYNMLTPVAASQGLGYIAEDRMDATLELMRQFQNLNAGVKAHDVYTLDYLPHITVKQ